MKKKVIIIIFIFILIIIGVSTAVYFFINKPSTDEKQPTDKSKEESKEIEKEEPPKDIKNEPIDAKCRGEIEDSFYQFEDSPIIGSDILSSLKNISSQFIRTIKQHIFKERFALASTFITDKTQLEPNKSYYVGRRKVSNLISGPMYGGKNNCSEYPDLVYKEKITLTGKNNWNLIKGDFYGPYGGDWSDSNVKTKPYTLEQAQAYAESRGYDGITYNGNGQETGNQFFMWKSNSSNINNGGSSLGWDLYKLDPTIPASKCTGSDCTLEGQKCLPGTEGAGSKTWICTNKKWVEVPVISTVSKSDWELVKSDFYGPYGGDWSNSNLNTKPYTLEQAQAYAESLGYDGITYKPLPGSDTGFNQFFMWKSSNSNLNNGGSSPGWNLYKKKFVDPNIPAASCTGYDCTVEGQKCLPGSPGSSGKTWICTNKKWVEAPTVNTDPCYSYGDNSTNISQECYNKIWKDAGCITPPSTMGDWHKSQSKAGLISDSKAWATMTDDAHRNGCYTTDKTKWPGYVPPPPPENFYLLSKRDPNLCLGGKNYQKPTDGVPLGFQVRGKGGCDRFTFEGDVLKNTNGLYVEASYGGDSNGRWVSYSDKYPGSWRLNTNGSLERLGTGRCLHPDGGYPIENAQALTWDGCASDGDRIYYQKEFSW